MSVQEPYKRYIVFAYSQYYPGGGLSDIVNNSDTLEEAFDAARQAQRTDDYVEIFDCFERSSVDWEMVDGLPKMRGYDR